MKKVLTILMLAIAIISVAPSAEAKTKKTSKGSSSSSWNGDVPPASIILKVGSSSADSQLKKHGYRITEETNEADWHDVTWTKSGVCKIRFYDGIEAADRGWEIEVYDSAKCKKLYNDLKREFKSNKYWSVDREGNKISISYWN